MNNNYFDEPAYQPSHNVYTNANSNSSIFLGDVQAALDVDWIQRSNIKLVVTAASGMDHLKYPPHIKHVVYDLLDGKHQNVYKYFNMFYLLVEKYLKEGSILVHCAAGISRSATLVIAYLMKREQLTFKQAIEFVRKTRKDICPNLGFQMQLKSYQSLLKSQAQEHTNQINILHQRREVSKTSQAKKHDHSKRNFPKNNQFPDFGSLMINPKQKIYRQHPTKEPAELLMQNKININRNENGAINSNNSNQFTNLFNKKNIPNMINRDKLLDIQRQMNESRNMHFKYGGLKYQFSEIKKKESAVSNRKVMKRLIDSRNVIENSSGLEQKFLMRNQIRNIKNLNNFQVIKLNINNRPGLRKVQN